MNSPTSHSPYVTNPQTERASALAMSLAQAEAALLAFTTGQIDAVVDKDGNTYLLRPAQQQLRQSEEWLKAVLDGCMDVITVVNRGGIIVFQNLAVSRVLGFEPKALLGTSIFSLIHKNDLSGLYFAFFQVIERFDECATAQFLHLTANGSYRMIEATVGRMRDASVEDVIITMRPYTEDKAVSGTVTREGSGLLRL